MQIEQETLHTFLLIMGPIVVSTMVGMLSWMLKRHIGQHDELAKSHYEFKAETTTKLALHDAKHREHHREFQKLHAARPNPGQG